MLASENGHTEIVKYLIESKASLDLQSQVWCASNNDKNQLFTSLKGLTEIVKYQIESKASVDLQSQVWLWCASNNDKNLVIFIDKNVQISD